QGSITVRVNDLDGIPIRGLDKDTVFVPHPPEALARVGVPGIPILDPAGTYVGTQVGREHRGILSEKTLPFIGMREFFFEALRAEIRRQAYRLICVEDVNARLHDLALAFPLLTGQMGAFGISSELLTRVLRALLREGISIRDLRGVVERLAEFDTIPLPPPGSEVIDDRIPCPSHMTPGWPAYLAFVRTGLTRYLSHEYGRTGQLRAYVLGSKVESQFGRSGAEVGFANQRPLNSEGESLRAELWTRNGPGTTEADVILTSSSARLAVRQAIAPEFPDLPVVAASELRPNLSTERIA